MKSISDQLRAAIKASGLEWKQLAAKTGTDAAAISRFVSGKRSLTLTSADPICRVLGLELKPRARGKGGKR